MGAPPVERVAQLDVCAVDVALADLASATLVRDLINVFAGERNVVFGGYDQALDVSDADK